MQVEEIENGYLATAEIKDGLARLAYESLQQHKADEINCQLTVWVEMVGRNPSSAYSFRINILSQNATETFRRGLDEAFGKCGWSAILNRAGNQVKSVWLARPRARPLVESDGGQADRFHFYPWTVSGGGSILFGDGEAGKTSTCLCIANTFASGGELMSSSSREQASVIYVDYEWSATELKRRCSDLGMKLHPDVLYWNPEGIPLAEQTLALRREIARKQVGLVIIDSAGMACGGKPEEAEIALRYFNAVNSLSVPTLTICHVTKAGEDMKPFGSSFYHYSARLTWNVKASDAPDGLHLGFFCRKANVGRRLSAFGARLRFPGGLSLEPLAKAFEEYLPNSVRLRSLLEETGALTRREIEEITGMSSEAVRKALQRMPDVVSEGRSHRSKWSLKLQ